MGRNYIELSIILFFCSTFFYAIYYASLKIKQKDVKNKYLRAIIALHNINLRNLKILAFLWLIIGVIFLFIGIIQKT